MSDNAQRQLHKDLLRRWEPVLAFAAAEPSDGFPYKEGFLPMPVDPFVKESSLWVEYRLFGFFTLKRVLAKGTGQLEAASLEDPSEGHPTWDRLCVLPFISKGSSLRFVQEDELRPRSRPTEREDEERIVQPGIKERGCGCLGVLLPISLLVWAVWGLTPMLLVVTLLVLVGLTALLHVLLGILVAWVSPLPDETAKAAAVKYQGLKTQHKPTYYGRMWQPQGYSRWRYVVQYWLFYAMNDWRTREGGLDDHEGDWEMVQVCVPRDTSEEPTVVYSQHFMAQHSPLKTEQPKAYVACGSHASYPNAEKHALSAMVAGKKGLLSPMAWLAVLLNLSERMARLLAPLWNPQTYRELATQLRETRPDLSQAPAKLATRVREAPSEVLKATSEVPKAVVRRLWIVDRATGSGETVYPCKGDQKRLEWDQKLLEEEGTWVNYQGRWGHSVFYPPESGPGGPCYHQDGSGRKAWRDPIGWAGLPR